MIHTERENKVKRQREENKCERANEAEETRQSGRGTEIGRWKTGKLISLSALWVVAAAGSMGVIRPGTQSHFLFHLQKPEPERL